jgi:hypothetical protein
MEWSSQVVCSTYERNEILIFSFIRKFWREIFILEYNIGVDVKGVGCEGVDQIELSHDRAQHRRLWTHKF